MIIVLSILITLTIVYPFLPGEYDVLALPVSIMAQVFGLVGLPLVILGIIWLIAPSRGFAFAITSMAFGTFAMLVVSLFATLSVGKIAGVLVIGAFVAFAIVLIPKIRKLKTDPGSSNATPLYLVTLPIVALITPMLLSGPLTDSSRDRAIAMAAQFIEDIEEYRSAHDNYPVTLNAQHRDYLTGVVGIERYYYARQGEGYNLAFEQPRFLFDNFGTREWVVYNSRDEHSIYSHASWLMEPGRAQGWYKSGDTKHEHWKWFWFD